MKGESFITRDVLVSKLDFGAIIHISNADTDLKYRTEVVGYDRGILITALPSAKKLQCDAVDYEEVFADKLPLVMRFIVGGSIHAFKSDVCAINLKGCMLLMTPLPEKIQIRTLRSGIRYPCALQSGFLIGETKYRGVLTNISEGGCLFKMKAISNRESLTRLMEKEKISDLNVRFPFKSEDVSFSVKIKSIAEDNRDYLLLGMYYVEADEVAKVVKNYFEFMQLDEVSEYLVLT